MINSKKFIRFFSTFTIIIALVHFVLETFYTYLFGQTWASLLPDYIAVALCTISGLMVLKNIKAVGFLCGAWGFAFCLHYRSWAWRFDNFLSGTSTPLIDNTMYVLLYTMPISIVAFVISLIICYPKNNDNK